MSFILILRRHDAQALPALQDAFESNIVTKNKIAGAQPVQITGRDLITEGAKTGLAREGGSVRSAIGKTAGGKSLTLKSPLGGRQG